MAPSKHKFEFFSVGLMTIIMALKIPVPKPFLLNEVGELLKPLLIFFVALLLFFAKLIIENYDNNMAIIVYDIVFLFANASFFAFSHEERMRKLPEKLEEVNLPHENTPAGKFSYVMFITHFIYFLE